MLAPLIRPFAALRPGPGRAGDVAAPPYDVLTSDEARARAAGRPWSFLHVSKAEIDLTPDTDPHDAAVYARAAANLGRMIAEGVLVREAGPCLYVYRAILDGRAQTGIAAAGSIAAYAAGRIRRHELTRPDKEDDRVRQIDATGAQTGPVFTVHRPDPTVAEAIGRATAADPIADAAVDSVRHQVWAIGDEADVARVQAAFEAMPAIYIADGHHRSAAAARVAAGRGGTDTGILIVSFPADEVRILDYNRVVRDLGSLSPDAFLASLAAEFEVTPAPGPVRPDRPTTFGLYVAGRWHRLALKSSSGAASPAARLDVSLLSDRLLGPVLGIGDPRIDPRIDFVGGGRGLAELERRIDSGAFAAAFTLHPTRLSDLMAVADAGQVMPPKSTWFEPKLADGLLSLMLD